MNLASGHPQIALVHDWLNQQGGAENVLLELSRLFPQAPIHTSFHDKTLVDPVFDGLDIRSTWMQWLPLWRTHHQALMPIYPLAFASTQIAQADVVISNCSAFCKGIRIPQNAVHVCYCLTPTRFVWMPDTYLAREHKPVWARLLLPPILAWARRWDRRAARRVTRFVAISTAVAKRIQQFYGRSAQVVYPPVDVDRFRPTTEVDDHFLIVSRLVPYKRIDLAVRTCTALHMPLRVIGTGRDEASLRDLAGPTIEFLGRLPDCEVSKEMARCRAFLFPGEEDFGIAPVEAQAAGRPVVAYKAGGALDTVVDGATGILFETQSIESLGAALRHAQHASFATEEMVTNAQRFSPEKFRRSLVAVVDDTLRERAHAPSSPGQT